MLRPERLVRVTESTGKKERATNTRTENTSSRVLPSSMSSFMVTIDNLLPFGTTWVGYLIYKSPIFATGEQDSSINTLLTVPSNALNKKLATLPYERQPLAGYGEYAKLSHGHIRPYGAPGLSPALLHQAVEELLHLLRVHILRVHVGIDSRQVGLRTLRLGRCTKGLPVLLSTALALFFDTL